MKMIMEASLIDVLAKELRCEYISDLRFLPACEYRKAARYIEEKIPADSASLFEWNDALEYLSGAEPESTPEAAKKKLIKWLSCQRG